MNLKEAKERVSQEEFPQEFNPREWEAYKGAGCYPYALGIKTDEAFLIGDLIGRRVTHHNTEEEILEVLMIELEEMGFEVLECDTMDIAEEGCFKIYLEINQNGEYHFLRQDSDGIWSHKAPDHLPHRKDTAGYEIIDPDSMVAPGFVGYCFLLEKVE